MEETAEKDDGHVKGGIPDGQVNGGIPDGQVNGGISDGQVNGGISDGQVNGGISDGQVNGGISNGQVNWGISDGESAAVAGASGSTGGGLRKMAINDTKAGMEGIDKDKINQIIEEASKGSKFYNHQQKSQEKLNSRMHSLHHAYKNLSLVQIQRANDIMDNKAQKMESERLLNRTIIHVDMDAFYAAVEMRDDPELRNVPMAVGGDSMLSTSNYIARKFGVRAGMPGFIGKKLCPELVIVPCNYEKYGAVSQEIHEVFKEYDPNFSSVSLDEAYLDITDYLENKNNFQSDSQMLTPEDVTNEIRGKIFQRTQLTASAGIASNSLLAKICGDINKPNGQYYLEPTVEAIRDFIVGLPIRKVSGIGNVTEQLLNSLHIFTCGDLWENRGIIYLLFKPATMSFLLAVSLGIGNSWFSVADTTEHQKSISSERTFSGPGTNIPPELCQTLCMDLERELISKDLKAKTVTLKIKTVNFEVKTRAVNLLVATNESDIIFETAWGIYKSYLNEVKNLAIRLLGVRLSNFESSSGEAIDHFHGNNSEHTFKPKKQERIDRMFLKLKTKEAAEAKIPKYECPMCFTKFFLYKHLEHHVHNCISQSEATEGQNLESNTDRDSVWPMTYEWETTEINHDFPQPGCSSEAFEAEDLTVIPLDAEGNEMRVSNDWWNKSFITKAERKAFDSEPSRKPLGFSKNTNKKRVNSDSPKTYPAKGKKRRNLSMNSRKITDYLNPEDDDSKM